MLKSCGWVGGVVGWWVAHVIIVSAQSKELGFGDFQTWSELLGQDLETVGTGDLDLGLTIISKRYTKHN